MKCSIVNETNFKINEKIFKECVEKTVEIFSDNNVFSCNIVLVKEQKIIELNEKYYNHKGATDVLSFQYQDDKSYMGEIIVCPSFIKKNKGKEKFEWEMCHVMVHGTLHLLGIHHEEENQNYTQLHKKEEFIINKILNKNN